MKILVGLLLCFGIVCNASAEDRWKKLISFPGYTTYVDTQSLSKNAFWEKKVYTAPQKDIDGIVYHSLVTKWGYTCNPKTSSLLVLVYYNKNGDVVAKQNVPPSYEENVPGSYGDTLVTSFCNFKF